MLLTSTMGEILMDKNKFYNEIKQQIMENKLKAGQPLVELDYSKKFHISRTPVREVFRKLESENLVTIIPHKGTYVRTFTLRDVEEILDIRIVLESYAASRAAEKIRDEDIFQLEKIKLMIDEAVQSREENLFYQVNKDLHDLILERCDNRRVLQILNSIRNEIYWFITITKKIRGRVRSSAVEHNRIIDALIKRDFKSAEKAMIQHLTRTKIVLLESGYFL
jgi:DNA-binding GntR family transcriptional regulator